MLEAIHRKDIEYITTYLGLYKTVNIVPVDTACHAVARTPTCMLWLDITEDGTLFCCLIARLTPTRSSPFSPLKGTDQMAVRYEIKKINKNC